jgi:hypothetical protein
MKRLMPSATVHYWLILCKCEQEIRLYRKLVEFVVEMNRHNQVLFTPTHALSHTTMY